MRGPEDDIDMPGEDVWIFGAKVHGIEHYIKLKINRLDQDDCLVCISFHKSERPLQYPYADE